MKRPRSDFAAVHGAADRLEPQLAHAFARAAERASAGVSINELAHALDAKDAKAAMALLPDLAAALAPMGTIARDAVLRGKRLGAERLNEALAR